MNTAMFQPGFYPMPQQNQRAFFPPAMTQMRQWGQPSINRPYNVPVQQQRGRGNVPRANMGGSMGTRNTNPSTTQRPVGVQQRNQLAQNQAVQQQQAAAAAAKLKFNANARNQPDPIATGGQGVVGGDRSQGMQVR